MTYELQDGATLRFAPQLLPDPHWTFESSQRNVHSGRYDLLFRDRKGRLHLVEMKEGAARPSVLGQVRGYARDLAAQGQHVKPWVFANTISTKMRALAERKRVRVHAISYRAYERARAVAGLPPIDLLAVSRRMPPETPAETSRLCRLLSPGMAAAVAVAKRRFGLRVSSTHAKRIQIFCPTSAMKGVLLGGVLLPGRHAYISKGPVASGTLRARLRGLGFKGKVLDRATGNHTYWQVPITENAAFIYALKDARALVLTSMVAAQLGE